MMVAGDWQIWLEPGPGAWPDFSGYATMRLSAHEINAILATTADIAGPEASVWLFGSRLDDAARGGDVDLLVEAPDELPPLARARLKLLLEARLGLPVDLLARRRGAPLRSFEAVAKAQARRLGGGA